MRKLWSSSHAWFEVSLTGFLKKIPRDFQNGVAYFSQANFKIYSNISTIDDIIGSVIPFISREQLPFRRGLFYIH